MKKQLPNLLGAIVRDYFTDHLPRVRGTSPHTIHGYRDSLVLLLRFLSARHERPITELDLKDLEPAGILAFLSYLEKERKNGVATRNVRITAIHALFRFVASRNPEHLGLAQQVLSIPFILGGYRWHKHYLGDARDWQQGTFCCPWREHRWRKRFAALLRAPRGDSSLAGLPLHRRAFLACAEGWRLDGTVKRR